MALKSVSKADPNYVPNYQLAGIPYVTSSVSDEVTTAGVITVNFPFATRDIFVQNTGGNRLKVGFTLNGVKGQETENYFTLEPKEKVGSSLNFNVRCKSVFFQSLNGTTDFSLFAGLTPIGSGSFPVITGSNGFEGAG